MGAHSFEDLKGHVGHKIVCVSYEGENAALECEDCSTVLLDFNREKESEANDKGTDKFTKLISALKALKWGILMPTPKSEEDPVIGLVVGTDEFLMWADEHLPTSFAGPTELGEINGDEKE